MKLNILCNLLYKYRLLTKALMVMKLTAILLLIGCLQAAAKGYSQKVTLLLREAALSYAFAEIEKQSGYHFIYAGPQLDKARKVSLAVKDLPVDKVLELVFKEQPLEYTVEGRYVIVRTIDEKKHYDAMLQAPGEITGVVTDEEGNPVPGVSVTIKTSGRAIQTDALGIYKLSGIADGATIIFSSIGFEPKEIVVNGGSTINVRLKRSVTALDETIIQGYGTTTRRLSTGNIGQVTDKEISRQPVMNPLQALQGRVPGVVVTQTNGYASAPFKVEIRGRNNINPNFVSEPLFIIDGVPLTVLEVGGNSNYASGAVGFTQNGLVGPAGGQSPFFSLNPSDIKSIEILKDADATAIYGSRGANGVILISTKKGAAGVTKLDVSAYQGISKVSRYYKMLHTDEYIKMRKEAFYNDSIAYGTLPDAGNAPDLLVWDEKKYTDWQKYFWGGTGKTFDAQLSLTGGDRNTNFRLGMGYHSQKDILTISGSDQRGSLSVNINHKNSDQRLSVNFSGSYSLTRSNLLNLPSGGHMLPPNAPDMYDSNGKLNWDAWEPSRYNYPFSTLFQPYTSTTNFFTNNLSIDYKLIRGLVFKTSLGYNLAQTTQEYFVPISSQDPTTNPKGNARFGNNSLKNFVIEPYAEYSRSFNKAKISITGGGSVQSNVTKGLYVAGFGYTNDALLNTISNAPTKNGNENQGEYRYAALFFRANFNWNSKYIINFSGRRDGSSRFGQGRQFGNFGAIGAAWIFTEQREVKKHFPFLTFGKLRASYGLTGSDVIGDYGYITRWSGVINSQIVPSYQGIVSLLPTQHANADYRWQTNRKLEAALEMGFLNERIFMMVAWYRNRCDNQLVSFPTPSFSGFSSVIANSPAKVENSGIETSLNAKIIEGKNFNWSINANLGINRNKLLDYPDLDKSPYSNILVVGRPLNIKKVLKYTGVNAETGLYQFEDRIKDGIISTANDSTDDRYVLNLTPKYQVGLGCNINYKGLALSFFMTYINQKGTNMLIQAPGTMYNQPSEVMNRWKKPGDLSSVPRFTTMPESSDNNFLFESDGVYTNASFARMQNLSLSYELPVAAIKKIGVNDCRVFINAQNLFVLTNYKGIDPETQNFGSMPTQRFYTGGIQFNF